MKETEERGREKGTEKGRKGEMQHKEKKGGRKTVSLINRERECLSQRWISMPPMGINVTRFISI